MSADRTESESKKRNLKPTIKEERSTEIEKNKQRVQENVRSLLVYDEKGFF